MDVVSLGSARGGGSGGRSGSHLDPFSHLDPVFSYVGPGGDTRCGARPG
ncbi:MAG TPA: hypothetical protein VFW50_03640 [Streptosporangiaceae bacterium]|nr:hypothetical protein [Streptosporangiaceae bacterium]